MGRKTRFTIQILLVSLFVMLATVFFFTDDYVFTQTDESASQGGTVAVEDVEDGTYTGSADGYGGPIEVEVTVAGGKITDINVLSHSETAGVSDPAFEEVSPAIIENNSTEVDVASGATFTSEGIMAAVNNALSGGSGAASDSDDTAEDEEATVVPADTVYVDGTYTGTGEGYGGPIEVEVTVEGGVITGVKVLEHGETDGVSDPAFENVPAAIVESNSPDVDVASGATASSEGIKEAVDNALSEAEGSGKTGESAAAPVEYMDGVYTGSAEGFGGPLEVEVTVEGGAITNVAILEHGETEGISDPALEEVPAAIVENNSTDVDVASGATYSSEAIQEAVKSALEGIQ